MTRESKNDRRGPASPTIEAGEASISPAMDESVGHAADDGKGAEEALVFSVWEMLKSMSRRADFPETRFRFTNWANAIDGCSPEAFRRFMGGLACPEWWLVPEGEFVPVKLVDDAFAKRLRAKEA